MAVLTQETKPKEGEEQQQMPQNQPLQVGASSGSMIAQSTPGAAPGASRGASPGGSRFFNINQYLNANKPGSEKLASGLQQKIGGEADKIKAGIQQGQQQFGQQAGAEQQRLQQGKQLTSNLFGAQPTQDLTKLSSDQQQELINLRTGAGTYKDLSGMAGEQQRQLQNQQEQLGKTAALTGTEAGRFQLLGNTFGRPGYAQGQKRLDQLLLQTGGQGLLKNLQTGAAQAVSSTGQELASTQQAQQAQIADVQQQASEAQAAAETGISGARSGLESELEKRAADQTSQSKRLYDILNKAVSYKPGGAPRPPGQMGTMEVKPGISQEDLAFAEGAVGKSDIYNKEMYGALGSLGAGAFKPVQDATISDVARQEDADKLTMLSKLGGTESKYLGQLKAAPKLGGYDFSNLLSSGLTDAAAVHEANYNKELDKNNRGWLSAAQKATDFYKTVEGKSRDEIFAGMNAAKTQQEKDERASFFGRMGSDYHGNRQHGLIRREDSLYDDNGTRIGSALISDDEVRESLAHHTKARQDSLVAAKKDYREIGSKYGRKYNSDGIQESDKESLQSLLRRAAGNG